MCLALFSTLSLSLSLSLSLCLSLSLPLSLSSEVQVEDLKVRHKLQLALFHMMQKKSHIVMPAQDSTALAPLGREQCGHYVSVHERGRCHFFNELWVDSHLSGLSPDTHGVPPRSVDSGSLCGEQTRLSARGRDVLVKLEYSCKQPAGEQGQDSEGFAVFFFYEKWDALLMSWKMNCHITDLRCHILYITDPRCHIFITDLRWSLFLPSDEAVRCKFTQVTSGLRSRI